MIDGERHIRIGMPAERWSHIADALALALEGVDIGYELRYGGSTLRDGLADIEKALSTPDASADEVCTCTHRREDHIYWEGACRPGFVCASACTKFVLAF